MFSLFPNRGLRPIRVLIAFQRGDTQKHTQSVDGKIIRPPGDRNGNCEFHSVFYLKVMFNVRFTQGDFSGASQELPRASQSLPEPLKAPKASQSLPEHPRAPQRSPNLSRPPKPRPKQKHRKNKKNYKNHKSHKRPQQKH